MPWLTAFSLGYEFGVVWGIRKARRQLERQGKEPRWVPVFMTTAKGDKRVWTLEDTHTHKAGGPQWSGPDAEAEAAAAARQLNQDFG